ncbi:MAG: hypothetical protein MUF84_01210 [Anaerolineae bacterium]|nr:hypothetical protein [Anaerolineae bacterium]
MKKLNRKAQQRARAFIFEHGRPLEQAKYTVIFEHSPVERIWEALAAFQNADGGFGHGMEPDLRLPVSSVLATTVGLQVLREFRAPPDHPLVQGAMRYLVATYDAAIEAWPIIPPAANEAPHAPWWIYDKDVAERWGAFLANPRAEIVGYLHDYAALIPPDLCDHLTAAALEYLATHAETLEMHEILCYVRLAQSAGLLAGTKRELVRLLTPVVDQTVIKDSARWGEYGLMPIEIVQGTDSLFAGLLADVASANLDYEIAHHAEDGIWRPRWDWAGLYPEDWEQAKQDWSGWLTMRMLTILKRFDRLEL